MPTGATTGHATARKAALALTAARIPKGAKPSSRFRPSACPPEDGLGHRRRRRAIWCFQVYPLSNSLPITPNTLESIESEPRQDEAAFAVSGPTRSRRITRLRDPRAKSNDVFERCGSYAAEPPLMGSRKSTHPSELPWRRSPREAAEFAVLGEPRHARPHDVPTCL